MPKSLWFLFFAAGVALFLFIFCLIQPNPIPPQKAECLDCVRDLRDGQVFTCGDVCSGKIQEKSDRELSIANWEWWFPRGLLVLLLALATFAAPFVLWNAYKSTWIQVEREYEKKAKDEQYEIERKDRLRELRNDLFVSTAVHFIPFAVLGLAMLFEYRHVEEGRATGMAAVGAIMVLYLLAELGAMLLSTVVKLRDRAESLNKAISGAEYYLKGVAIVRSYGRVLNAYGTGSGPPGKAMEDLVQEWGNIATERTDKDTESTDANHVDGEKWTRVLMRTLLTVYFEEEHKDLSGSLPRDRVPKEVWPCNKASDSPKEKAAFVSTNVGFFATFLSRAVAQLEHIDSSDREPCIVSVTNVLPSWWWCWPLDKDDYSKPRPEFAPIAAYRSAQEEAILKNKTHVFRTVLVAKDGSIPDLCSLERWKNEEAGLLFYGKKPTCWSSTPNSDLEKVGIQGYAEWRFFPPTPGHGEQHFRLFHAKHTGKDLFEIFKSGDDLFYRVLNSTDPGTKLSGDAVFVRDYYARRMHPAHDQGRGSGFTEILQCSVDKFKTSVRRPDITFVGTLLSSSSDVWRVDEGVWRPNLALLADMRPSSMTMFLTVVYDRELVDDLWKEAKKARNEIADVPGATLGKAEAGVWTSP